MMWTHDKTYRFFYLLLGLTFCVAFVAIPSRAQTAPRAHPGLYPVQDTSGKWGFIDATGRFRIAPVYAGAGEFSDGVAYVFRWEGDRRINGIVDTAGKFTSIPTNDYEVTFSEGLARMQGLVGDERAFGFVDKSGRVTIPIRFWDAGPFSEGLAWVAEWRNRELLYGFIDPTGRYVIPPRFKQQPRDFADGHAWVQGESDYGLIDRKGRMVFTDRVSRVDYAYSEGLLAAVTKGEPSRGVYLDRNGGEAFAIPAWNERTALQHSEADQNWRQMDLPFHDGLAPYRSFNKIGFIDKTGKIVIPAQFRGTNGFAGERAAVMVVGAGGQYVWGYIDRSGEMVIQPTFREANPFNGPLARVVTVDGVDQFIDRQGNVIWPTGR